MKKEEKGTKTEIQQQPFLPDQTARLLSRRDQSPLFLCIVRPSTGQCFAAILSRVVFDTGLEFGAEMSNETLQWPSECLSECYVKLSA